MSQFEHNPDINSAQFATLPEAARRYRLHDVTMTNAQVAKHLGLEHYLGDHLALPNCCFFGQGRLVGIRTQQNEVSIFYLWQLAQYRMERIAELIE